PDGRRRRHEGRSIALSPLWALGLAAAASLAGAQTPADPAPAAPPSASPAPTATAARPPAQPGAGQVAVLIEEPAPGTVLEGQLHQARIAGSASANAMGGDQYDVILVIDVSESTLKASGADIDRDGVIGLDPANELLPPGAFPPEVASTDPQDTVLHAEVLAARTLLAGLDPRRVRVGLVSFAGEVDPTTGKRKRMDQQDAWLEVPLTHDYGAVQRGLTAILARGAHGATNFAAALRLAVAELAGIGGGRSTPRADAKRVVLFLTDGMPTLPIGHGNTSDPGDVEAAVRAADLAHKAGVTVNTYALGTLALAYPRAATEIARRTLGTYNPVQRPGDVSAILGGTTFANVEDVVFANLTTGELSTDVRLAPDGTFAGYVPVQEGHNRVRVSALASDGSSGAVEFDLEFRKGGQSDRQKALELERLREMNRELMLQREADEVERFREQQRKQLEIRPEDRASP
ncbi:MAG TPA: vWA domain-containing protein, partial [Myxococcota bacterium]|nr:vWA domain-containing protein [Myxococcota bacterium]